MSLYDAVIPSKRGSFKDPKVMGLYLAFVSLLFIIWQISQTQFVHTSDHYMTISALLQTLGFLLLAVRIQMYKTVQGVSGRMLALYCISFVARLAATLFFPGYVPEDGSADWYIYQVIEIVGLALAAFCMHACIAKFPQTYSAAEDTLWVSPLVVASIALAVLTKSNANGSYAFDFSWMFAQWLDSLAMAPQLWMVSKTKTVERLLSHFISLTILARVCMGFFWICLQLADPLGGWFFYGILVSNVIHLVMSADYLYYFFLTIKNPQMNLPLGGMDM